MSHFKEIASIIAIILTFVGYAPYIRDIVRGKTRPHVFSWLVWAIITGIIYALQKSAGAGSGAWVTLILVFLMVTIFFLSLRQGNKNIKKIDIVFLVLALSALPLWLVVDQPVLSIILLSTIDMIGFLPTIRKSWNDPYSETLSLYTITTFRHMLSIIALANYTIVTWLFPATWVIANATFSLILTIRRNKISKRM